MLIDKPSVPRFQLLRQLSYTLKVVRDMRGQFPRECNICGHVGRFLAAARPPRYDAKCPNCLSVERHRLFVLANERAGYLRPDVDVLHFAPEPALSAYLRARSGSYESADIVPGRATLTLNLEALDLGDDSYDVVVASHILEHVDDQLALSELYRVIRPGGVLILFTPVIESWATTYERADTTSERQRLLHYGQVDHVRYYGRDIRGRILAAGFELKEVQPSPEEGIKHGLSRGETMFLGWVPFPSDHSDRDA